MHRSCRHMDFQCRAGVGFQTCMEWFAVLVCSEVLPVLKRIILVFKMLTTMEEPSIFVSQWVFFSLSVNALALEMMEKKSTTLGKYPHQPCSDSGPEIIESWNHRIIGWKRPLSSSSPTIHPTPSFLLNHILKCHIYTFFKHLCSAETCSKSCSPESTSLNPGLNVKTWRPRSVKSRFMCLSGARRLEPHSPYAAPI